jgi:multidrug efflux system outer membrane protein
MSDVLPFFPFGNSRNLNLFGISNFGFRICITFVFFSACWFLNGCKVGPDFRSPAALGTNSMPAAFTGTTNGAEWQPAEPAAHLPRGTWWQLFANPELNRLENLATANNQELAGAVARLEQARASVNLARADFFPKLELDPAYNRQRTSFNEPQNGRPAKSSYTYNTFTALLQAGWEPDLWGRIRRQTESARAQLTASADDTEALKLAIQAEVAMDYFILRRLVLEHDLIERTIEAYRHSLELTVNRRKGGVATDLDVSQAETQLRTAQAELPAVELLRTKMVHVMAILCGQSPESFVFTTDRGLHSQIPLVPVSLPSELLQRRPDVAAAEQRMAAANAQIGVAQSAFYPRVQFSGLAGVESVNAATWLEWPSRLWSVGPTLQLPIFTGGRNRAQLALAKAAYDETVASYRQSVLSAFAEVEDQLAAQRLLDVQMGAETQALTAAQRTLEIANNRYKGGLVTYLEVATAQSAALNLERTVLQLRGQKYAAIVGLIKAMGGGWQKLKR